MKGCVLLTMLPFILPIALVVIFVVKLVLKGKNASWKGKIIDKTHTSKRGSFEDSNKIEHNYVLKIMTEDNKERNIAVSPQLYDECSVGDVIEKPKGELYPKKVKE